MEKKIIEILLKHSTELNMKSGIIAEPEIEDWLWSGEFEKVAQEIVKLFAIPGVSFALSGFMDWLWLNHNILTNANNNKIALEKYLATL